MGWVENFFDDPLYDLEYAGVLGADERTDREVAFITDQIELSAENRVLDLACGHGRHALRIAKALSHVVGYDRSERFVEHARKRAEELVRLFGEAGFAESRLVSAPDGEELTIDSRRVAIIGTKI